MDRKSVNRFLTTLLLAISAWWSVTAQELTLPNRPDSLKYAAFGDNGTGEQPEYDVANQLDLWHRRFPFDMVIMLGDNMYGSQRPADFERKFERPYKPLLDPGVRFFASLGNHDNRSNDAYPLFNMHGERYYTYVKNNVRFVVVDSNALDSPQVAETKLGAIATIVGAPFAFAVARALRVGRFAQPTGHV
jgi:hypothetical protein